MRSDLGLNRRWIRPPRIKKYSFVCPALHTSAVFVKGRGVMPRARQRIVQCDCFDCVEDQGGPRPGTTSELSERVARQEPPPKCLLILGSGFLQAAPNGAATAQTNLDAANIPHLDKAARDGCSGLLSVRQRDAGAQGASMPWHLCNSASHASGCSGIELRWHVAMACYTGKGQLLCV